MVDDVRCDTDIGPDIVGEHGVAAVRIARAPREIAAGYIDLDPIAGADGMMNVREVDGQSINPIGFQMLRRRDG